jgi:hypothetical protein
MEKLYKFRSDVLETLKIDVGSFVSSDNFKSF